MFNGVTHLTVTDNSANDINPDPNPIIVRSSALLAAFGTKIITGRSVSASSNLATAAADGPSSLLTQFTFGGKAGQTSNFTVTAGHMGYTVPGDPKTMNTSASLTVTNSGAAGTGSFQGSVGTTNGPSNAFDALIATTSAGNAPNSSAGSGAGFIFSNGNSAYSVQNVLKAPIVSTKTRLFRDRGRL